jgi:hypothetical protein
LERLEQSSAFLDRALPKLIGWFANGDEIDPERISLRLIRVRSSSEQSDLFRLASMTWSVPVSQGFGRRLRYLVWDDYHDRLVGIFALGDPVYNLAARDDLIGWNVNDRASRLVNLLDAYVLGAVPPYNMLLAGKAVACLVRSRDVYRDFSRAYGQTVGIISGAAKRARLLAVTTSSSMGRSSIYNRLKLDGIPYFQPVGYTIGWGHFHITDKLFADMREYLRLINHPYADQHQFGDGPNWRLRTIRVAISELGVNKAVLKHGIRRQVFLARFASNSLQILKNGRGRPDLSSLLPAEEISEACKARWLVPRAGRMPGFRDWNRDALVPLIYGAPDSEEAELAATG